MNRNTTILLGVAAATLAMHQLTKNTRADKVTVLVITGVVANLATAAAYDHFTK